MNPTFSLVLAFLWAILCGYLATRKGRSFFGYFVLSFFITPLFTMILVACLSSLKDDVNGSKELPSGVSNAWYTPVTDNVGNIIGYKSEIMFQDGYLFETDECRTMSGTTKNYYSMDDAMKAIIMEKAMEEHNRYLSSSNTSPAPEQVAAPAVVRDAENKPIVRFCMNCGKKLNPNYKFCGFCGKKIEEIPNDL